jgi:glutathione reductase (NADPH)
VDSRFSWPTLIANKNREIAQLEDFYRTLLKTSGVRLIEGRARIRDPNTVEVAGTPYTATNILIATGGWPTLPTIPGVRLGCEVAGIERRAGGALEARLITAGNAQSVVVDAVLYATGRHANTQGLGLESADVAMRPDGAVVVDEYSRTSTPNIFAVGDVTQRIALTPVAIREGAAVANTLFGGAPTAADHVNVPHAVFSLPPVGVVGLTETQAREVCAAVKIYKTTFRPLKYTLSGRNERTLMKLVVNADNQRVLGAHMVGPDAPEIIQAIAIAVKAGLTKQDSDATVALHPTAAEEFVTLK